MNILLGGTSPMNKNIIELLSASLLQNAQKATVAAIDPPFYDPADKPFYDLDSHVKNRNIIRLIETAIDYIGKEVLHQGEVVTLSWSHLQSYLKAWVPKGYDLHGIIDFVFRSLISAINPLNSKGLLQIIFKGDHEQIAGAYVDFLRPILILRDTQYPQCVDSHMVLREEQYFFCRRFVMNNNGKLVLRDPKDLFNNDMLLKTLRADAYDFSYLFILGIIPGINGVRRLQNLRPKSRQPFTVTPNGIIEKRFCRNATHSPEEKKGFSQVQSCTLIDKHLLSPAFGFAKDRNSKLYGLMTDSRDALFTRLLVNDSGTVSRPFDHDSQESAGNSWAYHAYNAPKNAKSFFSKHEVEGFKARNIENRTNKIGSTNECLARLRFNPYHSVVSICSDTLESRLLAADFAQEILEHFATYAEHMGAILNPAFRVPIIFYIEQTGLLKKSSGHDIKLYTDDMFQKDQAQALAIYNNNIRRKEKYESSDYEFLLGLPEITLDILLEPDVWVNSLTSSKVPLALVMMRNGHVRMLARLLRIGKKTQPNIRKELVDYIVANKLITQNDRAITELILAEQFDMVDTFIAETQSFVKNLPPGYRGSGPTLPDQILEYGTPRQIKYAGLEQTWLDKPINNWVPVLLFIKEHPNLPRPFLGALLRRASASQEYNAAKFLLKCGAPTTAVDAPSSDSLNKDSVLIESIAPISIAAMEKDWEMVHLFSQFQTDDEDRSEFGYALLAALRDGQRNLVRQLLQNGAKATWRNNPYYSFHCRLTSTLHIALERGFDELLPQLIDYEDTYTDIYSVYRNSQALKLAYAKNNQEAVDLIQRRLGPLELNEPVTKEAMIYEQILEAYFTEGRPHANQRLLVFSQENQFLPSDDELTSSAREWLSALFQSQFSDKHRNSMIEGLRTVIRLFHQTQLKKRCTEAFIDWVLINTIELLKPQEQFTMSGLFTVITCLKDQSTLNGCRQIIVNGIVESLSSSFRAALNEKSPPDFFAVNKGTTPISIAAQLKDWELVSQIAHFPTDAEDTAEYGYALYEALQEGLISLVTLLLAAGAKPTWRKNPYHSKNLRSTLSIAIELGFNELLPELIEHEKKYHDDDFLLRIEQTLELAFEKNNQEAIAIIQKEWGPIILFDDTNIILSICQRVLATLRIEGEVIAKKRLLNYLQQYHLLPKENELMAPLDTWRIELFQQLDTRCIYSKDEFLEALKIIIPHLCLDKLITKSTSALIDWILNKEISLQELIDKLSRLKDLETLKSVGQTVIDSIIIINTVNCDNSIRLKLKGQNPVKRLGVTPISRLAMEKDWELVLHFTNIRTDSEDRCEYGYALFEALCSGEAELAKLLIRAGAKPTWRNNPGHTIENKLKSTCWAAIDRGLTELLPQLIDYEKNYSDHYTRLGFEYALALAHEKDNQDAIRLIQEKVGPITLFDCTALPASICRQVLISLTIEGQYLAERRLLNYCRQYSLLHNADNLHSHAQLWIAGVFQRQFIAKNACLVIEGMRIIMQHVCGVLITLPDAKIRKKALKKLVQWIILYKEPTLFGLMTNISHLEDHDTRNYFAHIVINTILRSHPIDLSLIRQIVALNFTAAFGKEIWKITLESRCDKIRTRKFWNDKTDDEALLLFELNPTMSEDLLSRILDSAIHRVKNNIARALVTRPDLSRDTKNKMLSYALDMHYANKTDRTIPLMMKNNFPVSLEHLNKALHLSNKDYFFFIIDHFNKAKYPLLHHFWHYVSLYVPATSTRLGFKIFEKLIDVLGPSMIRHIILLCWLMNYKDQSDYPNLSRFYVDNELSKKCIYYCDLIYAYKNRNNTDEVILVALNTYFADNTVLPKEDILLETYTTIMTHLEFSPHQTAPKSTGFFALLSRDPNKPSQSNGDSWAEIYLRERKKNASKLYRYMHDLDQLLRRHEETLENNDVNTPLQLSVGFPFLTYPQ